MYKVKFIAHLMLIIFLFQCSAVYDPKLEFGIHPFDEEVQRNDLNHLQLVIYPDWHPMASFGHVKVDCQRTGPGIIKKIFILYLIPHRNILP